MRLAVVTLAALALTACGSHAAQSPESAARAWSAALDRNDNEAAGKLFADGAQIVQNGALVLRSHRTHNTTPALAGVDHRPSFIENLVRRGALNQVRVLRALPRGHGPLDKSPMPTDDRVETRIAIPRNMRRKQEAYSLKDL